MMARDRDYPELRDALRGRKVLVWTCNTCSRLCNGIGGSASAEALADALRADGIEVTGVMHTSASCLDGKIRSKEDPDIIRGSDIILSLTCDVGSRGVGRVFCREVLNPMVTFGPGYAAEDGRLFVCTAADGSEDIEISELAARSGLRTDPFV